MTMNLNFKSDTFHFKLVQLIYSIPRDWKPTISNIFFSHDLLVLDHHLSLGIIWYMLKIFLRETLRSTVPTSQIYFNSKFAKLEK